MLLKSQMLGTCREDVADVNVLIWIRGPTARLPERTRTGSRSLQARSTGRTGVSLVSGRNGVVAHLPDDVRRRILWQGRDGGVSVGGGDRPAERRIPAVAIRALEVRRRGCGQSRRPPEWTRHRDAVEYCAIFTHESGGV
jgi:hypothetical protein